MPERYYIDTCIWRDLHENREDKFRPLGEWAFNLFRMIRETKSRALYSDLVVEELLAVYDKKAILEIFKILSEDCLLEEVKIKKEHFQEAARLKRERKLPFGDLIHAILARDNHSILVTRDKHFEEFGNIVVVKKPEELV